jgi:hypothetical protein
MIRSAERHFGQKLFCKSLERNGFHKKRAGKSGPSFEGGGTYKADPIGIRLMRR